MSKKNIITLFLFILLAASLKVAYAETTILPIKKEENLTHVEKNIEYEKEKQQNLTKESKKLENNLKKIQKKLINISSEIRKNEENLTKTENSLKKLQAKEKEIVDRLKQDYSEIADTILLMQRMERTPPETIILRPGGPYQAAQSSIILQNILPIIKEHSDKLSSELDKLASIQKNLKNDRKNLEIQQKELVKKQKELKSLTSQKKNLLNRNKTAIRQTQIRLSKLSKKAKDMKDLIKKLQEEEKAKRAKNILKNHKDYFANLITDSGEAILPASGVIKTSFGDEDEIGAKSKGITIKTRPGALVVAPMDGIVRYAGIFKNYGNIIIIEHANNYHSLISGLEKFETDTNQKIKSGEPVGYAINSSDNPIIYYELRYNGSPVNPNRKIAGL